MVEFDLSSMAEEALRALLRDQVSQRRAFVPGVREVPTLTPCVLVLPLPGGAVRVAAEVVFACGEGAGCGVGLQLEPLPAEALAAIDAFVRGAEPSTPPAPEEAPAQQDPRPEAPRPAEPETPEHQAVHVRLRSLTGAEQRRYALTGNLAERVLLERLYGPNVWEALLSSGRLSMPEVATIARKGTVPQPLLEIIAANAGWIASGEVQRALLTNPRTSHSAVKKVLRMLPRHELARVPKQTAYPMSVRQAAVVLLKPERGRGG